MASVDEPRIRPIALAVVRRRDDLLVFEAHDPTRDQTYYRPLGGGIDFGEPAATALRREMREELAVELENVVLLGVLENLFTAHGRAGHEIVFVFAAELADPSCYDRDDVGPVLDDGSPVTWQPLSRFTSGQAILYPAGLLDLVAAPPTSPGP
jgi:ADP-ribose pyrophosphatase YjhB (NUDIX family)